MAQSVSMAGVALFTTDTGGYCCGNTTDPVWRELVVRWTQFSAFLPIMRFHGRRGGDVGPETCGFTNGENEPWSFGEEAYAAIVPMLRLRESLRPYVLAMHALTVATGMPMVRPLALEFPADPLAAELFAERAYMFGDRYLVSPVTVFGAREWTVYLPAGATWAFFFNGTQTFAGGANATLSLPDLATFPLFERMPPPA